MSQPPSSWDPNAGQQDYSQGQYGGSGGYAQQPSYSPPPQYGGYPPAETQQQYGQQPYGYGQPGYPPQYGTPYGAPGGGAQRPGAALAAAVLSYIQAGVVLLSTFFVLAIGSADTEFLLIGILQLVSVGLLIFGAVQITSGTGRLVIVIASVLQLVLVLYWLIRFSSIASDLDFDEDSGVLVVIPLFYAVMPAVALGLIFNRMVTQFIAAKSGQRSGGNQQQWGQ